MPKFSVLHVFSSPRVFLAKKSRNSNPRKINNFGFYIYHQAQQSTIPDDSLVTVNCTVAYMAQCMSWNKCKASCTSMGASSYR